MAGFIPLNDLVLVKRVEPDEKSAGGLYIPTTAQNKKSRGVVIAAGKGKVLESGARLPLGVKVGDTVLFGKYSGVEMKIEGTDHLVLKEEDIFGVLE